MHIWANMSGTCISNMVEIGEGLVLFWFKGMAPMHPLFIRFYKVVGYMLACSSKSKQDLELQFYAYLGQYVRHMHIKYGGD